MFPGTAPHESPRGRAGFGALRGISPLSGMVTRGGCGAGFMPCFIAIFDMLRMTFPFDIVHLSLLKNRGNRPTGCAHHGRLFVAATGGAPGPAPLMPFARAGRR